jgi:predicted N-acetyltransferase YhbS
MAAEWEKRAPNERHWHLGPVGVEPALQNMAVGSRMMGFCTRMDTERGMAWLETDKLENVRFFTRFGFAVVDEAEILRLPNWFMRREPGRQ